MEHLGLHADGLGGVVELGQDAVEDVRRERDRVVDVAVAVDDVADVVQLGGERDDDRLVGLLEALVAGAVELDAGGLQQVVERQRAVADDLDVLLAVVVVPLPDDGVDVLGLLVGVDLGVSPHELEDGVEPRVGERVVPLGVVREEALLRGGHGPGFAKGPQKARGAVPWA